jgi:hypothetical protein
MRNEYQIEDFEKQLRDYQEEPDEAVKKIVFSRLDKRKNITYSWISKMACFVFFCLSPFDINRETNTISQPELAISRPQVRPDFDLTQTSISSKNSLLTSASPRKSNSSIQDANTENVDLVELFSKAQAQNLNFMRSPTSIDTLRVPKDLPTSKQDSIISPIIEKSKGKQKRKNSIKIYGSLSPSLAYLSVYPSAEDKIVVTDLSAIPTFSSNRVGLSLEAGIQVPISKYLEGYLGVSYYYQKSEFVYNFYDPYNLQLVTGSSPNEYYLRPINQIKKIDYSMQNVGIQSGILFHLKGDKLKHKPGLGVAYQHGLQRADAVSSYNNSESSYLLAQLLYRIEYQLNPRLILYVQPSYTQSIIADDHFSAPISVSLHRAGIGLGFVYSLHN